VVEKGPEISSAAGMAATEAVAKSHSVTVAGGDRRTRRWLTSV
jgi:hypothetical protein